MKRAAALLAAALLAGSAAAGPLSDFEKKATTPSPSSSPAPAESRPPSSASDGDSGDWLAPVVEGCLYGGFVSAARTTGRGTSDYGVEQRQDGDALIPYARGDAAYQFVRGGVSAVETRAEAGWAWIAVRASRTLYWDRTSNETLSTTILEPMYRMSFGDHFELDLGAGAYYLVGRESHAGSTFTVPVKIEPSKYWGVEYIPAWHSLEGETIRDNELALRLGARWASLRAGYRWVESGGARLDGPFAGAMLTW